MNRPDDVVLISVAIIEPGDGAAGRDQVCQVWEVRRDLADSVLATLGQPASSVIIPATPERENLLGQSVLFDG